MKKEDTIFAGGIFGQHFQSGVFKHFRAVADNYPMHLGILGTIKIIYSLKPKAAIISEFGSELRDIRNEVVGVIADTVLEMHTRYRRPQNERSFICPGDLTIIYDIAKGGFCCHDHEKFEAVAPEKLKVVSAVGFAIRKKKRTTGRIEAREEKFESDEGTKEYYRAYLVTDKKYEADEKQIKEERNRLAEDFFQALYEHKLPIHKPKPSPPTNDAT